MQHDNAPSARCPAAAMLLAIALGCASAMGQLRPTSPRASAVAGLPVVLRVEPGRDLPQADTVPVALADGTSIEATVHRIAISAPAPAGDCRPAHWLGPIAPMRPVPIASELDGTLWYLRLPETLADGTASVSIDGRRVRLEWVAAPAKVAADAGLDARLLAERSAAGTLDPLNDPWASPVPAAFREDPVLLGLTRPALDDPALRWRAALALTGLHPIVSAAEQPTPIRLNPESDAATGAPGGNTADRSIVDDLADLRRARWQVALLRLWIADRQASLRVRRALAGAMVFEPIDLLGQETAAPVWLAGVQDAQALLRTIEQRHATPRALLDRVGVWRAGLPSAFAFAVDDAGMAGPLGDDTAAPLVMAGSLLPEATLAAAVPSVGRGTPPIEVRPWTVRLLEFDAGLLDPAAPTTTTSDIRIGDWTQRLRIRSGVLAARPPGIALGPLIEDITLPLLLAEDDTGSGLGRIPLHATAARLERRIPDPARGSEPAWIVYLECRRDPALSDEQTGEGDAVRLWLGPTGDPLARIRVTASGRVSEETGRFEDRAFTAAVSRTEDRWAATITLPSGVIPPSGVLRVGMDRLEPCGRRTAWPRPLLPWQQEPGRIAIDTAAWRGIDSIGAP